MIEFKKLPNYWSIRLYLSLSVLILALTTIFDPARLAYRIIAASGAAGFWCILGLACLSLCAVIDVVVNDLLPDHCCLHCTERYRHLVYMGLALGLMSTAFVIAQHVGLASLHAELVLESSIAAALAFIDLYQRHRQ